MNEERPAPVSARRVALPADEYFAAPIRRIRAVAAEVVRRPAWDVLMIVRRSQGFDLAELAPPFPAPIRSLRFVREPGELDALATPFDVCLLCSRVVDEELLLYRVRERGLASMIVVWAWDNHHSQRRNLQIASLADLVIPAHRYCAGYLKTPHTVLGGHVPLGTYQWSRATAAGLFQRHRAVPRDDALHGGFVAWPVAREREAFVQQLLGGLSGHALRLVGEPGRDRYFAGTAETRWLDWATHKAGLILPYYRDLSTRFFDSLLTGQVPIVPDRCGDFDAVIGPELARMLPVVRLLEQSVEAVGAAWREAVARYDTDGQAGAARRHAFALDNHHVRHRLAAICSEIAALGAADASIQVEAGRGGVGPVLQRR